MVIEPMIHYTEYITPFARAAAVRSLVRIGYNAFVMHYHSPMPQELDRPFHLIYTTIPGEDELRIVSVASDGVPNKLTLEDLSHEKAI